MLAVGCQAVPERRCDDLSFETACSIQARPVDRVWGNYSDEAQTKHSECVEDDTV